MSTAIIAHPSELDESVSTVAETTRELVYRAQDATNFIVRFIVLWQGNRRIRSKLEELRTLVSNLTIEDDDERAKLLGPADRLRKCVDALDSAHGHWVSEIVPRIPSYLPGRGWIGPEIAHQLEELACTTEDIAETLALAASGDFAQAVKQELAAAGLASAQVHETV